MKLGSFFVGVHQNSFSLFSIFLFSENIFYYQMVALMMQATAVFRQNTKKQAFNSAKSFNRDAANTENCVAKHEDKTCFLTNCFSQTILKKTLKSASKNGRIVLHIRVRGLSFYTIQVWMWLKKFGQQGTNGC